MTTCEHCGRAFPLSYGPRYTTIGLACPDCWHAILRSMYQRIALSKPPRGKRNR